ncbi:DUF4406 domain-containing protein [uncultured Pseudacidovorax sp.]|uniref:DUF4406 domain-containing protein n=1 Tax=uncultured Pseudacidovorax sp. TaxID=679313 RepID=UPI0025FAE207|nr:DUF4406 domain-containing protein [uncultured Pseudacidovorax sp.]
MTQRWYVAGPMSHLPENNYPAFHAAAAELRALGHHVENPAENPRPDLGPNATEEQIYQEYLRMGIAQLVTCTHVLFLAGWQSSGGALKERMVASWVGIEMVEA